MGKQLALDSQLCDFNPGFWSPSDLDELPGRGGWALRADLRAGWGGLSTELCTQTAVRSWRGLTTSQASASLSAMWAMIIPPSLACLPAGLSRASEARVLMRLVEKRHVLSREVSVVAGPTRKEELESSPGQRVPSRDPAGLSEPRSLRSWYFQPRRKEWSNRGVMRLSGEHPREGWRLRPSGHRTCPGSQLIAHGTGALPT